MSTCDNSAPEHATAQPEKPAWRVRACVVVILFALFSCSGWVYETVENLFSFGGLYLRASLMLPWCPIYGIGGLVIVAVLEPVRRRLADRVSPVVQVAAISVGIFLLTATVELVGSYVCEAAMGYVPWDYSEAWLSFQGRIAPMYTLRFVLLGLVALYVLYPKVHTWAERHPRRAMVAACASVVLFVCDYALESTGVWSPMKDALGQYGIKHW
jgi:uncharacterized membrane protein